MDEKKVREEYLKFPWGIADTIENLRVLKSVLQRQVEEADCDGKGAQDALEVGFDFDRAIEALEKQLAIKPKEVVGGIYREFYECKNCGSEIEPLDIYEDYCKWCGQRLDWTES